MSQPKRYDDQGVWKCLYFEGSTNGWVKWDDYAALAAENERLRKAGDAMYHTAQQDGTGLWLHKSFQDWNAAKEGRDAK